MAKFLAKLISYIIHPGIIPTAGAALSLALSPHYIAPPVLKLVLIYVFLGTYVFPLLMALLLLRLKMLSSLSMPLASERRLPYITAALFYFLTARSMSQFPIPDVVAKFILAGIIVLGIALACLAFFKISIHAAGISALLTLGIQLSIVYKMQLLGPIALLVLFCGAVGTARLVLKSHSISEIMAGYALGAVATLVTLNA